MQIIYEKISRKIIAQIPDNQNKDFVFRRRGISFLGSIDSIIIDEKLFNIKYYYVDDDNIIKRYTDNEIEELNKYGHVLTEEERLDILLQPTPEEVIKANSTIEVLSMLQEVGLI